MEILAESILEDINDIHSALDQELQNIYKKAKQLQTSYNDIKNEKK